MTATKTGYREWIRRTHGSIYQERTQEKHRTKKWRINQNFIRDTFIEQYMRSGSVPTYMITRSYYYEQYDMKKVKKDNKRINNVIEDFFNPRNTEQYHILKDHFIERHKDKFVKKNKIKVKDTILKRMEVDWDGASNEIKKGGFHVHSLFSEIDDDVVLNPNSKVRKWIKRNYGLDTISKSLLEGDEGLARVKIDLLDYALRKRCDFIGDSKKCLDVKASQEYATYDGYRGWQGMVAYVTKSMYNVDNILESYDEENSHTLHIS